MASFGSATLILTAPEGSATFDITSIKTALGRAKKGNDIVISAKSVATHHCELVVEDGELVLRDLGSAGGSFVNGRRVHSSRLYDGDHLRLGDIAGRIEVHTTRGKPMRAPDNVTALPIIASLIALAFLGTGCFSGWTLFQRTSERALFVDFETRARDFLEVPSPCLVARETTRRLAETEERLAKVGLVDIQRGKTLEREQYARLLAVSELRQTPIESLLTTLDTQVGRPLRQRLNELRPFQERFRRGRLGSEAQALLKLFEEELAAQERFQSSVRQYRDQVAQMNGRLRQLVDQETRPATHDPLPWSATKADVLQSACEATFSQLSERGMLKLGSVPL